MPLAAAGEAERLAALQELAILDTAPEQIYDDVVALAAAICDVPIAIINFVYRSAMGQGADRAHELRGTPRGFLLLTYDRAS